MYSEEETNISNKSSHWSGLNYNDKKDKVKRESYAGDLYIGNLPSDFNLSECFSLFNPFGRIFQIRINLGTRMYNRSKGYGFIKFYDPIAAELVYNVLQGLEIRKGINIRIILCRSQRRIMLRNIPVEYSENEILKCLSKVFKDIKEVKSMTPQQQGDRKSKELNCGLAFVEFYKHGSAVKAMRVLCSGNVKFWGQTLIASWMEPAVLRKEAILTSSLNRVSEGLILELLQKFSKNGVVSYILHFNQLHLQFRTNYQGVLAMKAINGLNVNGNILWMNWINFA